MKDLKRIIEKRKEKKTPLTHMVINELIVHHFIIIIYGRFD